MDTMTTDQAPSVQDNVDYTTNAPPVGLTQLAPNEGPGAANPSDQGTGGPQQSSGPAVAPAPAPTTITVTTPTPTALATTAGPTAAKNPVLALFSAVLPKTPLGWALLGAAGVSAAWYFTAHHDDPLKFPHSAASRQARRARRLRRTGGGRRK